MKIAVKAGIVIEITDDNTALQTTETGWAEKWAPDKFKWPTPIPTIEVVGNVIGSRNRYELRVGDPDPTDSISQADLDAHAAMLALEQDKQDSIDENLPTWAEIEGMIDDANGLAEVKVVLKRVARVLYWMAKNQEN